MNVPIKEHFDKILDLLQENITLARDGLEVRLVNMRHEVDELNNFRNNLEGKASQADLNRANLLAGGGIVLGVVSLLWSIFKP